MTSTRISVMEWIIPAIGVRPPFLILAAVLAMAPVAGIPPKKAEPILPNPCAISSMLERWCELIILSATTQDNNDSIAANIAIVKPSGKAFLTVVKLMCAVWKTGSLLLIVYRSPIVLTFNPINLTNNILTIIAISEPGIFSLIRGQITRMIRLISPTIRA